MCLLLCAQAWQLNDQQLFFIYGGGKAGDTLCISLHVTCRLQISKQCFKIINIPPGEEGGVDIPPGEEGGVDGTMSFYAGNKVQMLSCFVDSENQPLMKNVCALTLLLDESSADRLSTVRGFMNIEQEQHLYVVPKSVVTLKPHDRLHYAGTNRGIDIYPITMPQWTSPEVWQLPLAKKKEVIGKAGNILIGGAAPGVREIRRGTRSIARFRFIIVLS